MISGNEIETFPWTSASMKHRSIKKEARVRFPSCQSTNAISDCVNSTLSLGVSFRIVQPAFPSQRDSGSGRSEFSIYRALSRYDFCVSSRDTSTRDSIRGANTSPCTYAHTRIQDYIFVGLLAGFEK